MERRELLGLMGLGTAGLIATASTHAGLIKDDKDSHHDHNDPKHAEHLRTLGECMVSCNATSHHCLEILASEKSEHREHHAKVHSLTMDCQAFCALTMALMARHSMLSKPMHQACAEACAACAAQCEKGQSEVEKHCAEKCRACEKACRACCEAA